MDRYDESRGCLLKTIAEHRIRGAVLDYLRQVDPLPRRIGRFQKHRDAAITEFTGDGGNPPLGWIRLPSALECLSKPLQAGANLEFLSGDSMTQSDVRIE